MVLFFMRTYSNILCKCGLFFQTHQELHPYFNRKHHMIRVPGIIDKSPNLIKGDTVYVFKRNLEKQFELTVEDVSGEMVITIYHSFYLYWT